MGAAGDCTVLALDGGRVEVTGGGGGVDGDLCVGPNGNASITGRQRVTGAIRLAAGATLKKSGHGAIDGVFHDEDLTPEITDAVAASADAAALPCTQTFRTLDRSGTIRGTGGLNVICVRDVTLNGHRIVTVSGGPTDTFVVNVRGRFVLTGGSEIVAAGVPASAILYNVIGSGEHVALTGNASLDGTILAPGRDIALTPGFVNGAVIGGRDISLTGGATVRCPACPRPAVCGGLPGTLCPAGSFCELPPGQCCCDLTGMCVALPTRCVCPLFVAPVCGCDGMTYTNDCVRRCSGVSKDHDGPCP